MDKRTITGALGAVFFGAIFCACAEESITITTYYPSPQGVYKQLRLYPNNTPKACSAADNEGWLYYNNTTHLLNVCVNNSGAFAYQPVGSSYWNLSGANLTSANSSWNVGIGTVSPSSKLNIHAGTLGTNAGDTLAMLDLNATAGVNNQALRVFARRSAAGTNWYTSDIYMQKRIDSTNMGFIKWPGAAGDLGIEFGSGTTTAMRVDDSGSVSVGTLSTPSKFTVATDTALDGLRVSNSTGTKMIRLFPGTLAAANYNNIVQDNDNALIYSGGAFVLAPHYLGLGGIRMTDSGRVSVGVSHSYGTLNVGGGIRVSKGLPSAADSSQSGYTFDADGDSGMFATSTNPWSGSDLVFMMDNVEFFRIALNGNIYSGGSSPVHADYVFEPGYKLIPIQDQAVFMWQNKHLPAIPKGAVEADGRSKVEIRSQLRGIVEELEKAHVYIEQLYKENQNLKQRLNNLEKAVNIKP